MNQLEKVINNSPFYHFLRFSKIAEFSYELLTAKTKKTAAFYRNIFTKEGFINEGALVFDIGANKGNKTNALLKLGFKIIAIEPEKKSISTLKYRFKKNKNVQIVEAGVSSEEGHTKIYITEARSGLNTMNTKWKDSLQHQEKNRWSKEVNFKASYDVSLTTADALYSKYGTPYFIKIDVEGYELEVIKGIKKLPQFISFEANLPEFTEETIACIKLLGLISKSIEFNFSFREKLVMNKWINEVEMIEYLSNTKERYIEIIMYNQFK